MLHQRHLLLEITTKVLPNTTIFSVRIYDAMLRSLCTTHLIFFNLILYFIDERYGLRGKYYLE